MAQCKVFLDGNYFATASLAAPPHVGEYIWFTNKEGNRIYYKVETVVHSHSNGEIEVDAKIAAPPLPHKR